MASNEITLGPGPWDAVLAEAKGDAGLFADQLVQQAAQGSEMASYKLRSLFTELPQPYRKDLYGYVRRKLLGNVKELKDSATPTVRLAILVRIVHPKARLNDIITQDKENVTYIAELPIQEVKRLANNILPTEAIKEAVLAKCTLSSETHLWIKCLKERYPKEVLEINFINCLSHGQAAKLAFLNLQPTV